MVVCLAACKPGTPRKYIQPDKIEDIMVDYHLAVAMASEMDNGNDREVQKALLIDAVLRKHGVTQAEFDSSMVYYYKRSDRFESMYRHIADRLDEQALRMGASESELGAFTNLGTTGDTANIWTGHTQALLMPVTPYNRLDFTVEIDSTFKRGDSFMLRFGSDYLYQDGARQGMAYIAVKYDTDTIVTRNMRFQTSDANELRVNDLDANITGIKGYFLVGEGAENTTTQRLVFLRNIQLIRFHNPEYEKENKKDSIAADSIARRTDADPIGGRDTVGHREGMLPADSGATIHRVVRRVRPAHL